MRVIEPVSIVNYTDIHCHILPSVDDGAQTIEESKQMIQLAYENGTRTIIATPHYGNHRARASKGAIIVSYMELQEWVKNNYPDMRLYLGQELFYSHQIEKGVQTGKAMTMAGSRYVLVEFDPDDSYSRIRQGLEAVQMAGYWPILAHAERYHHLMDHIEYIEDMIHFGVCIQINARSVTGQNGWKSKSDTKKLLKNQWVHFVASDGHDTRHRQPVLKKAMDKIARRYGKVYSKRLVTDNPHCILTDTWIES